MSELRRCHSISTVHFLQIRSTQTTHTHFYKYVFIQYLWSFNLLNYNRAFRPNGRCFHRLQKRSRYIKNIGMSTMLGYKITMYITELISYQENNFAFIMV